MEPVIFTLQTLTPLFLAGANQGDAELRAPSFRGLMRYWYRVLIGGLVGADKQTLLQVKEAEAEIFGTTEIASAVKVQIAEASKLSEALRSPQRHRRDGGPSREDATGKDYLLWSMTGKRLFFPEDTAFDVTLSSRGNDDTKLQQAVAAFWLLTHLGGIGSRSRRCAGSLAARVEGGTVANLNFATPRNVDGLQQQLEEGIRSVRQSTLQAIVKQGIAKPPIAPVTRASFDALAPNTCKIWILYDKNWTKPDHVMRALGEKLQDHRGKLVPNDGAVFGRATPRLASPLLLRVTKLEERGYAGVAVLFKTDGTLAYHRVDAWANSFSGKVLVTF